MGPAHLSGFLLFSFQGSSLSPDSFYSLHQLGVNVNRDFPFFVIFKEKTLSAREKEKPTPSGDGIGNSSTKDRACQLFSRGFAGAVT
jgi:hypothetical protein